MSAIKYLRLFHSNVAHDYDSSGPFQKLNFGIFFPTFVTCNEAVFFGLMGTLINRIAEEQLDYVQELPMKP